MATGESVENRIRALYGDEPLERAHVVHVVATWRAPDASLRVIRIGLGSPHSTTDQFILRSARMRADAIVTTGKILRDEPDLDHDEFDPELLAWRREDQGRPLPTLTTILTSGLDLDFDHPLLGRVPPPLLVVPSENQTSVESRARAAGADVEVLGRDAVSLRDTLCLLAERGCESLLVEAGPSTTRDLYEAKPAVDELWLSVFEEPELGDECIGEAFADAAQLRAIFDRTSIPATRTEESGRWSFQRLWRTA